MFVTDFNAPPAFANEKDEEMIEEKPRPPRMNPFADEKMVESQIIPDQPGGKKEAEPEVIDAGNMDFFMNAAERQRAATFYEQLQKEREESLCKFCDKVIFQSDLEEGKVTMLQSTECFHQVRIDCLREEAIKQLSENKKVKCPKCGIEVQDWEVNEYLSPAQKEEISKNQTL